MIAPFFRPGTLLEQCIKMAERSDCKKLRFGVVVMRDDVILSRGYNTPLMNTRFMCEGACVRESIPSRTNSMVGACAHAEERAIMALLNDGQVVDGAEVYVAGIDSNGFLLDKTRDDYSCLRCATFMSHANIQAVHVFRTDFREWVRIPMRQAVVQAHQYAVGAIRP